MWKCQGILVLYSSTNTTFYICSNEKEMKRNNERKTEEKCVHKNKFVLNFKNWIIRKNIFSLIINCLQKLPSQCTMKVDSA